jgi:hypothetical protein
VGTAFATTGVVERDGTRRGEAKERFREYCEIEKGAGQEDYAKRPAGYVDYPMTRKEQT